MSNQYALLIGVDLYDETPMNDGGYYPRLKGCVRDINQVEEYLRGVLKLPVAQITKLTISGQTAPAEPAEQWPTYENMVAAFRKLTDLAVRGDQVYIHYSGHGGRAKTNYPEWKGADGVDEALVPPNIADPGGQYLRDVEIHDLLKAMVDKGLVVTVVLDSCHSGGATRALIQNVHGAIARGPVPANWVDKSQRPSKAGSRNAAAPASAVKQMKSDGGWLLEPKGYTLLAACRANESAYEYPFNGIDNNGVLTHWLLDTLRCASPGATYKMLYDRILAKTHAQFDQQTPLLEGEGDVMVFASERRPSQYAVTVLEVDNAAGRVRLNAGQAQGVELGSQFMVYPLGTTDLTQSDKSKAVVEVIQSSPVDCWAKIVEQEPGSVIDQGSQAVLKNTSKVLLKRGVRVAVTDANLRQEVETAIRDEGNGFLAVANGDLAPDLQVVLNDKRELELQDPSDSPLAGVRSVPATQPGAAAAIVKRAVHVVKFNNVLALSPPDESMKAQLSVELIGPGGGSVVSETTVFHPGDSLTLEIRNQETPNPADPNDPNRVLNITVLDLASDWSITQIYPALGGAFEPLDPGKKIPLSLQAALPAGANEIRDTLKVFATRGTTDFHWLELPALDEVPTKGRNRGKKITDPLEQVLEAITRDEVTARHVLLTSSPQTDGGWTTSNKNLHIEAR